MTLHDIEKFFRQAYPTAGRVTFEVDHTGSALHVIHEVPTSMHGVWGLDGVEQFPGTSEPSPPERSETHNRRINVSEFKNYPRKGSCTARPYIPGEDLTGVSVSDADKARPSLDGGMIARNPDNPSDQWYINPEFFAKNYGDPL